MKVYLLIMKNGIIGIYTSFDLAREAQQRYPHHSSINTIPYPLDTDLWEIWPWVDKAEPEDG